MKLLPNEAHLTKTNKIKLPEQPNTHLILTNPISGVLRDIENRIYQILELNNLLILDLEFFGGEHIYLSQVGVDHEDKHEGVYVYYMSKTDAIGQKFGNATVSRSIEWNKDTKKQFIDRDVYLRGVIVKGHR